MGIIYTFLKDKMHKMALAPTVVLDPTEDFTIGNGVNPSYLEIDGATGVVTIPSISMSATTITLGATEHFSITDDSVVPIVYLDIDGATGHTVIPGLVSGPTEIEIASGEHFTVSDGGVIPADYLDIDGTTGLVDISKLTTDAIEAVNEPTGFESTTATTISYNAGTQVFTIAPVGPATTFSFWHKGQKITKTGAQSTTAHADANKVYYFYFDASNNLVSSESFFDLSVCVPVAYVLYTTSLNGGITNAGILFDERHGIVMDWATHKQLHLSVGAFLGTDCAVDTGSYVLNSGVDADITPAINGGTIYDEDLVHTVTGVSTTGPYTMLYRLGVGDNNWDWYTSNAGTAQKFPFRVVDIGGATYHAMYNDKNGGNWRLTRLTTTNQYFNVFACATNSIDPAFSIIFIQGQTLHTQSSSATAESIVNLEFGSMPFNEIVPLYQFTYRHYTSTGGSNGSPGSYVNLNAVQKILTQKLTAAGVIAAGTHNSLSQRTAADCHPITSITYSALQMEDPAVNEDLIRELAANGYNNDFVIGSATLADTGTAAHDARIWFDKSKYAFRVGSAASIEWDDANVGVGSAVVGGVDNIASGVGAANIGGQYNTNAAISGVAMGERANATLQGTFNISGGYHATTNGTIQSTRCVLGRSAVTGTAFLDLGLLNTAANRMTVPQKRAYAFVAWITGVKVLAGSVDSVFYKIEGLIKNVAGTTSIVGVPVVTLIAGDVALTGAGDLVTAVADDANNALLIQVKSIDAATTTINWTATVDLTICGHNS